MAGVPGCREAHRRLPPAPFVGPEPRAASSGSRHVGANRRFLSIAQWQSTARWPPGTSLPVRTFISGFQTVAGLLKALVELSLGVADLLVTEGRQNQAACR
jgi:hypothetical protein